MSLHCTNSCLLMSITDADTSRVKHTRSATRWRHTQLKYSCFMTMKMIFSILVGQIKKLSGPHMALGP